MNRFKRVQGNCSFKCCDEQRISPGSPYIQMRPAEIPFSIQLLKIQEPCPPFQMVSLNESGQLVEFPVCVCVFVIAQIAAVNHAIRANLHHLLL